MAPTLAYKRRDKEQFTAVNPSECLVRERTIAFIQPWIYIDQLDEWIQ